MRDESGGVGHEEQMGDFARKCVIAVLVASFAFLFW